MTRTRRTAARDRMPPRAPGARVRVFDVVDFLRTDQELAAWLTVHLEDGSPEELLHAFFDVCRARGVAKMSRRAGMTPERLARELSAHAVPHLQVLLRLLHALGLQLEVKPRKARTAAKSQSRAKPAARRAAAGSRRR